MSIDIKKISTESRLENSYNIDQMETIDILKTINNDIKQIVPPTVKHKREFINKVFFLDDLK